MKNIFILCVAIGLGFTAPAAFARGGMGGHGGHRRLAHVGDWRSLRHERRDSRHQFVGHRAFVDRRGPSDEGTIAWHQSGHRP